MFCKYCGTPSETPVCPNCAAAQAQPQVQPQAQPQNAVGNGGFLQILKSNLHFIAAGVATLALIWGILNIFCVFHVYTKISLGSASESGHVSLSNLSTVLKNIGSSTAPIYIGNILFGLTNLLIAGIGALYFLKGFKNLPLYDNIIGNKLPFGPVFIMGALGVTAALLQVIVYLFYGGSTDNLFFSASISVGVNWTTWMLLVLYAGVAVLDMFFLNKPAQPAVSENE